MHFWKGRREAAKRSGRLRETLSQDGVCEASGCSVSAPLRAPRGCSAPRRLSARHCGAAARPPALQRPRASRPAAGSTTRALRGVSASGRSAIMLYSHPYRGALLNEDQIYAVLPWMYLLSGIFPSADVAFISYVSLNFIFGLCTLLMTTMPRLLAIISKAQNLKNVYDTLKWVFMIFPQFCLGQGLIELCYNQIKYDLTHSFGIDSYVSPFEMQFLDWIFVGLATQGTILFLLRVLLHGNLLHWLGYVLKGSSLNKSGQDKSTLEAGGAHG
ncbi:uncharacterized protein LOC100721365 isoform X3 [Cavia porcellus]|uniref:uncharacterized protein LOC100721365 isoform X3 n=1 Tax=Cavia porcellus TaxID=10141 RepID=UPI002FE0A053